MRPIDNEDDLAKAQAKAVADTSNIMVNYMIKESGKVSSTVKESYQRLIRILEDPKIKEQAMRVLAGEITVVENIVLDDKGKPAGKEIKIVEIVNKEQREKLSAMVRTNVPRYIEESLLKMKIAQAQEMAKTIRQIESESVSALKKGFEILTKGDFFDPSEGATIMDTSIESVTSETMPAYVEMLKERLSSYFEKMQGYTPEKFKEYLQKAEQDLVEREKYFIDMVKKARSEKDVIVSHLFETLEEKLGPEKIAKMIGTDLGDPEVQQKVIQEIIKHSNYFEKAIESREKSVKDSNKLAELRSRLENLKASMLKKTKESQSDFVSKAIQEAQKMFQEVLEKETPTELKRPDSASYLKTLKVKKTGAYTNNVKKELEKMINEINAIDPTDISAISKVFDKTKAKTKTRKTILDLPDSVLKDLASSVSQGMDTEGLLNAIASKIDSLPEQPSDISQEDSQKLAEIRQKALQSSMEKLSEVGSAMPEELRESISQAILSGGEIDYEEIGNTIASDFEAKTAEIKVLQQQSDNLNKQLDDQLKAIFKQKKQIATEKMKEEVYEINQRIKQTTDPEERAALKAKAEEIKKKHEQQMENMRYSQETRQSLEFERRKEIEEMANEREFLENRLDEIRRQRAIEQEAIRELRQPGGESDEEGVIPQVAAGHAARVINRYEGAGDTPGIKQSHENLQEASREVANITGNTVTFGNALNQMMAGFGGYMLRLRLVQRGFEDIFEAIRAFQELEDISFELGIVSQMDVENIREYRKELLQLATGYRQTAEEIGRAQIAVVKTGVSLRDASAIVSNALMLARATYSDLQSATESINKILLPMERSGEAAAKVADWVYNVTVSTPASLASVEQSLRQTSSVFSGLLDDVVMSGQALDDYKDSVIETQLALIGLGHVQGKTGLFTLGLNKSLFMLGYL